jgi:Tfp pilus assembly protein PilF
MLHKGGFIIASLLILNMAPRVFGNEVVSARDYNQRGLNSLAAGDYGRAEDNFRSAIAMDPGIRHYYNNLAAAYMKQGKYEEAHKFLIRCLSMDKGNARALSNMAVTSFRLFRFREAYGYYRRAMAADRENTGKRFEKGRVISQIRKMITDDPENKSLVEILKIVEKRGAEK